MSRVTYVNTQSTPEQERLRDLNQVRLILDAEEGLGVNAVAPGVYGFTYSPALQSAPLFATRRFRSFETHKLASGDILIIGFVSEADAAALSSSTSPIEVRLQPEPEEGADSLVTIPYARIAHHRQYAVRTEHGITLQIAPLPSGV
jgi:hypothetical protein